MRSPRVYQQDKEAAPRYEMRALKGREVCVIKRTGVDGSLRPSMKMGQVVGYS